MTNNYPMYAAGVSFQKADESNNKHFYSAQVVVDPSDDSMSAKLTKDGEVISELPDGGGSSDLSTAIVTLRLGETSISGLEHATLNNTLTLDDEIWTIAPETLRPPINTTTKTVVLYQGKTYLFDNMSENAIESVAGNISYDDDNAWYVITGDCTVVLAGEGAA